MPVMRFGATVVAVLCSVCAWADVTARGRVVDAAGKAVPGAQVFWLRPPPINSYPECIDGKADDKGEFQLTLVTSQTPQEVRSEVVFVHAEGHGLLQTTIAALIPSRPDGSPNPLTMDRETQTSFRVTDSQDRALAGQLVEPVLYAGSKLPMRFVQETARVTDDNGIARFSAFQMERLRAVRVISDTFGSQQIDFNSAQPLVERNIALRDAGRVAVKFESANGLAMGKCKILVSTSIRRDAIPLDPFALGVGSLQGTYAEFFDNPKSFEIPAMAEGELRFLLSGCTNQEPALPHWPEEKTTLRPGDRASFTVPIERTVAVTGRILEKGQPSSNVAVSAYTRHAACSILTHTDQEGRFRVNVLQGPVSVSATLRSQLPAGSVSTSASFERVVGPDGAEFPDIMLERRTVSASPAGVPVFVVPAAKP